MSDHEEAVMIYVNCYRCPQCGASWVDEYDAMPEMDCDVCGLRHITPLGVVDPDHAGQAEAAEAAFRAYIEQIDAGAPMIIIDLYARAARDAGCNPDVLKIVFSHRSRYPGDWLSPSSLDS